MPVYKHYEKQLESSIADLCNVGGREAGSCTGMCTLSLRQYVTHNFQMCTLKVGQGTVHIVPCNTTNNSLLLFGFCLSIAAAFLRKFVTMKDYAHFDIAGMTIKCKECNRQYIDTYTEIVLNIFKQNRGHAL